MKVRIRNKRFVINKNVVICLIEADLVSLVKIVHS